MKALYDKLSHLDPKNGPTDGSTTKPRPGFNFAPGFMAKINKDGTTKPEPKIPSIFTTKENITPNSDVKQRLFNGEEADTKLLVSNDSKASETENFTQESIEVKDFDFGNSVPSLSRRNSIYEEKPNCVYTKFMKSQGLYKGKFSQSGVNTTPLMSPVFPVSKPGATMMNGYTFKRTTGGLTGGETIKRAKQYTTNPFERSGVFKRIKCELIPNDDDHFATPETNASTYFAGSSSNSLPFNFMKRSESYTEDMASEFFDGDFPAKLQEFNMENTQILDSRYHNDFEELECLGRGQFGSVFRCRHRLDCLEYAVKCTKNKFKGCNMDTILHEAFALAALSVYDENPYIVRYYTAWIEDDRLYMVMELCEKSLSKLAEMKMSLSEQNLKEILRDVCLGLRQLHAHNIVHLDIKPENILFAPASGRFKIGDLGLARIANKCEGDPPEGDARYLAPELLDCDGEKTDIPDLTKADIFSTGAMIYELMIPEPLEKNGPQWHEIRSGSDKLDTLDYSHKLKECIRSMLNSDPDKRPSAKQLLETFLLSDEEIEIKKLKAENEALKLRLLDLESKPDARRGSFS
mmetsp:Transcript_64523/g.74101  ORF Transcript_64523/g.74101 Transcript_64523/m.74101 type:complete len:577 (-) Transcript_64523:1673-3403(-)